jgi:ubiquinone/menaquinone biosynthesis C-methylase UbiE
MPGRHLTLNDVEREEDRIRKVYANRKQPLYSIRYSFDNPANRDMAEEQNKRLFAGLTRHDCLPLRDKRILDVGCGRGFLLRTLLRWGAQAENLFGIDLLPEDIDRAKDSLPRGATVQVGNAVQLPYPDNSFDLVMQSTVFSSIVNIAVKAKIAEEMLRVLKKGGFVVWYDFFVNNPSNREVRGVGKREIYKLFPDCRYRFERLTLLAPLARSLGRTFPQACWILSKLRVLSTHYLVFLRPI